MLTTARRFLPLSDRPSIRYIGMHSDSSGLSALVNDCYQCGKCTAGCPLAAQMDIVPSQLVRLAQAGQVERATRAESIWLCVSCQTCTTRCPQSVDVAGVIDALREQSAQDGTVAKTQRRTAIFQQVFLDNIRRHGRLNELELVGAFKTQAFLKDLSIPLLMKDALLAPQMMKRDKLHFAGKPARDRQVVDRIFAKCAEAKV